MIDVFVMTPDEKAIDAFRDIVPHAKAIVSSSNVVTEETRREILTRGLTEYFYLVTDPDVVMLDFDFSYVPPGEHSGKIHMWDNNKSIRLYDRKQVRRYERVVTDWALDQGFVEIYHHPEKICTDLPYDIVFISYKEVFAQANLTKLVERFPRAKSVHGVKGIFNAHKAAAKLATTSMVYVVDADAVIADDFDFSYKPPFEHRSYVHVWKSHNPLNGLEYGNGGVKLFPTALLSHAKDWNIDFTTSAFDGLIEMDQVSNTLSIDETDYDSWKSAFRECVKLTSRIIKNQVDDETEARIQAWVSKGNSQSKRGAIAGIEFGEKHKDTIEKLSKINDFKWLRVMFHKKR